MEFISNGFEKAYHATSVSIGEASEGVSKSGMEELVENIKLELLQGVSNKLKEVSGIATALQVGWQGKGRDAFIEKFDAKIYDVCADLQSEYADLLHRLAELMANYYNQDLRNAQEFGWDVKVK